MVGLILSITEADDMSNMKFFLKVSKSLVHDDGLFGEFNLYTKIKIERVNVNGKSTDKCFIYVSALQNEKKIVGWSRLFGLVAEINIMKINNL